MLLCGIGGGGTSGAKIACESGGDRSPVLIVICGGAFGLRREGMETFRGTPFAVCGGNGYGFDDTTAKGRGPGCDAARDRSPRLTAADAGSDDGSLTEPVADPCEPTDSVGDEGMFIIDAGADVLMPRLREIVPITVEELINGVRSSPLAA